MITNVYIDGFNLYYRALKDTPFRWLDLRRLAETLFPQDSINRVSYFTARLDARPGNPSQRQRQQAYLRALATLPGFDAYYGVFRSGVKCRPLAAPSEEHWSRLAGQPDLAGESHPGTGWVCEC